MTLSLTQTQNMSYLDVSSQLGPAGRFAGYRYATIGEVERLWADAGMTGPKLSCSPQPVCFAQNVPLQEAQNFVSLLGNTWAPSYGFAGNIGLTSTPYVYPWPGCGGPTCYLTPEVRIYTGVPPEALVVEALQDWIASPSYASWLVATPEPSSILLLGPVGLGLLGVRRKIC